MTDRHFDLRSADIASLNPPSTRRMLDVRDKREPGLVLRLTSKSKGGAKRSWTWRYRDGGGKQRRIVFGHWPAMTYAEAVRSLQEARETQSAGEDPIDAKRSAARAVSGRLTVSALVERYALVRAPSLKSGAAVVRMLQKNVAPAIGALAVAAVTGDNIRGLLTSERERMAREAAALQKSRQETGGRPPNPRSFVTLSRIYAACGSLFTFAVNESVITASPMPKLKKGGGILPNENPKGRAFTDAEIGAFWNELDNTGMDARTRNALRFVLLTGMRPGEVLGLQRRDIDLSATFVDRRGGAERTRGHGLVTLLDTKNSLPRIVPLSPQSRAIVADALRSADAASDAYVFPADTESKTPKPMAPQTLARAMQRRSDVFGGLTPHRLRAMCAFIVERLGFGAAVASDVLGHIDGSVLRRSYSGFDGLPLRADALEAVGAEIERIAGQKTEPTTESAEIVTLKRKA
jgi:integrase